MREPGIRTGALTWTPKDNPAPLVLRLMGRVEGATNPESCDLLADGEHFLSGNCTMTCDHPLVAEGKAPLAYVKGEAFPRNGKLHAFLPAGDHREVVTKDGQPVSLAPDFNVFYPRALAGEPAIIVPDLTVGGPPETASIAVLDFSGY